MKVLTPLTPFPVRRPLAAACAAVLTLMPSLGASAARPAGGINVEQADTLHTYLTDEAVVAASPRETAAYRRQPVSVAQFGAADLRAAGVSSLKHLSAFAPNLFMPDYGSRLSSAVYVRGVGSRMGTPAVGLYVDNVAVGDKSAYDFGFLDVARIDVLRGSQGTLYGRGAMGGLVRITTSDPLTARGTDLQLGLTGRGGGRSLRGVTYLHAPAAPLALSVGAYAEGRDGFYRNRATGTSADGGEAGGVKLRGAWRPSERLRLDLAGRYDYSREDACPYFLLAPAGEDDAAVAPYVGMITQNRPSSYRRNLLDLALTTEWRAPRFVATGITALQHLQDRLYMDQDFTAADIFSLEQRQRINTFTQEVTLKTLPGAHWQRTTGLFFMLTGQTTACPVTFHGEGVDFLNRQMATALPPDLPMQLALTDGALPFVSRLETPALNAALFHQSAVDLGSGITLTAGLRLDYDARRLHLSSTTSDPVGYAFAMPAFGVHTAMQTTPAFADSRKEDTWQLLPKLALQYNHRSGRGSVYAAIAKGYRSGGYNVQSYSDQAQALLRRNIMTGVRDYSAQVIASLPMLPPDRKEQIVQMMRSAIEAHLPAAPSGAALSYRPEQSWTGEVGGHLDFFARRLALDYTLFYTRTTDLQLARFAAGGMGRELVNAGSAASCGLELTARASLLADRLRISAAYGFTHSEFTRYDLGAAAAAAPATPAAMPPTAGGTAPEPGGTAPEAAPVHVDYTGHRVPFAPQHTLALDAAYSQALRAPWLRAVTLGATLNAAGSIYWDEANTMKQPLYATLAARLALELPGSVSLEVFGRNLTAARYQAFSFESLSRRFAQYGAPRHFGATLRWHF